MLNSSAHPQSLRKRTRNEPNINKINEKTLKKERRKMFPGSFEFCVILRLPIPYLYHVYNK